MLLFISNCKIAWSG